MTGPLRQRRQSRSADGRAARHWALIGTTLKSVPVRPRRMVIGRMQIRPTTKPRHWAISLGTSLGNSQTSPHMVPNKLFQPFPGVSQGFHSCPVVRNLPKSRVAHNPKVEGSNPSPQLIQLKQRAIRRGRSESVPLNFRTTSEKYPGFSRLCLPCCRLAKAAVRRSALCCWADYGIL